MASGAVLVKSYLVRVSGNERHLILAPESVTGDAVNGVFLLFSKLVTEDDAGYYNPDNKQILANTPLIDFHDMYHVVQTERPVYFRWNADDSNQHKLTWFNISTEREVPGEGPGERETVGS